MGVTWNTFVEGDNLEVLATLEPASVDLVYIDPPYNTGNDFAYHDDFRHGAGSGSRATRHDAWVAMMRPRLRGGAARCSARPARSSSASTTTRWRTCGC